MQNKQLNQHICDTNFDENNSKNQHISKVHDKIKEFKSPELKNSPNTKFLQASVLNVPKLLEGKKSFNCYECNICFDKKGNLNEHIAAIHEFIQRGIRVGTRYR